MHIKMLELLEIEFGLFFYTRRKRVTAINFQIDNKEALPYFLKMGGERGAKNKCKQVDQIKQRDLALSSKSQNVCHSKIPFFSTK